MADLPCNCTFVTTFTLLMRRGPQYSPDGLYDVRVVVDGVRKLQLIVLASAVQFETFYSTD